MNNSNCTKPIPLEEKEITGINGGFCLPVPMPLLLVSYYSDDIKAWLERGYNDFMAGLHGESHL